MKLPAFDRSGAKWDEYRRFHVHPRPWFVQFESGEAIITAAKFDPAYRRGIPGTDLRIVATTDDDCPWLKFDPKMPQAAELARELEARGYDPDKVLDGTRRLPRAWLDCDGAQTLLVDETTGRTVAIGTRTDRKHAAWATVPRFDTYRRVVTVYLPGADKPAVASVVELRLPRRWSADEKKALASLRDGCLAWCTLVNNDVRTYAPNYTAVFGHKDASRWNQYIYQRQLDPAALKSWQLEDILPEQRFQIAQYDYARSVKPFTVDHLLVA